MFDLFTFFVYLSLLFTTIFLTYFRLSVSDFPSITLSKITVTFQYLIALLIISFVVGFRYNVGVDWSAYVDSFVQIKENPLIPFRDQNHELGFFFINKAIAALNLSYEWMFFSVAFISWLFIFKSIPKSILPLSIFFLFADEYLFFSLNGVRQFVAIGIWMYASHFIISKNFFKYCLAIIFASLFHKTVLFLIPIYFLPFNKIHDSFFWIFLFAISFVLGWTRLFVEFMDHLLTYLTTRYSFLYSYNIYIGSKYSTISVESQPGLGFAFKILVNLMIIATSSIYTKLYPRTLPLFILFFFGSVLYNLFYNIQLMDRFINYFLVFRSVVLAFLAFHFWKMSAYKIPVLIFFTLYLLLFLTTIYNSSHMCTPFRFTFFQL